jgi:hypothetical protein
MAAHLVISPVGDAVVAGMGVYDYRAAAGHLLLLRQGGR